VGAKDPLRSHDGRAVGRVLVTALQKFPLRVRHLSMAGNSMRKHAPPPGRLVTWIDPS
jgi:hypothetical protein